MDSPETDPTAQLSLLVIFCVFFQNHLVAGWWTGALPHQDFQPADPVLGWHPSSHGTSASTGRSKLKAYSVSTWGNGQPTTVHSQSGGVILRTSVTLWKGRGVEALIDLFSFWSPVFSAFVYITWCDDSDYIVGCAHRRASKAPRQLSCRLQACKTCTWRLLRHLPSGNRDIGHQGSDVLAVNVKYSMWSQFESGPGKIWNMKCSNMVLTSISHFTVVLFFWILWEVELKNLQNI